MQIGQYNLKNNLLLAPMAGITDLPFRQLCRRLGAGLGVTEMVSANPQLKKRKKTLRRLDFTGESGPISVQIVGADPATMAEAAKVNTDHGAQIIDINMGCPAKKVCKRDAGSALMRDEKQAGRILEAVVKAVTVPVTLKIRTGWNKQNRNAVKIAQIAESAGIQALAIHGRTRACQFSGSAEYDTIRAVKKAVTIPVIANGDIDSPEKAQEVLYSTKADGLMIGRASQGRPWIFREINHYLQTGEKLAPPTPEWIRDILLTHMDDLYSHYGVHQGVCIARKHIAWYSREQSGNTLLLRKIYKADTIEGQRTLIKMFFDRLPTQTGVDSMMMETLQTEKTREPDFTLSNLKRSEPLRNCIQEALTNYFRQLNGHKPSGLYKMVISEVEQPLLRSVMEHTKRNQTHAARILGISRSTLRKKLSEYNLD